MAVQPDSAFALFVIELNRIPPQHLTAQRVVKLLLAISRGQRMYVPTVFDAERVAFARRQLQGEWNRPDVVRRIRERYEVSEATAYRIVRRALDQAEQERLQRVQSDAATSGKRSPARVASVAR